LNGRNDRVAPRLGRDNKISPGDGRKADTMLGAAINAPALNDWRLAANGPMAYQPFPGAEPGSDNAVDVPASNF
jgi:hypothetical protein